MNLKILQGSMVMIKVDNIFKKYGEKEILSDVSLELPKKKIISFIGSNGAGKSTLLSIITRTLSRDSGNVVIENKNLEEWRTEELAKVLSILKQSNHLNTRLTVKELVSFGRYPYSKGKLTLEDEEKVGQAIEYMGLKNLENRFIDELSGGQRQMAYIAMVIAQDTEYIFLDEPLNNLDMKHSVQIMKILRNLVDEKGKTIIIVIHDINFVASYSDYIVALKDGKMIRYGNTEEIMKNEVLKDIYGMEIPIYKIENRKFCLYY